MTPDANRAASARQIGWADFMGNGLQTPHNARACLRQAGGKQAGVKKQGHVRNPEFCLRKRLSGEATLAVALICQRGASQFTAAGCVTPLWPADRLPENPLLPGA
jgi:hypothetical protein